MKPLKSSNEPAFPCKESRVDNSIGFPVEVEKTHLGLTLRDYFAAKVLQAEIESYGETDYAQHREAVAVRCYEMADAMIAARNK